MAIKNLKDDFEFTTEMNVVDKVVLLNAPNTDYRTMLTKYPHFTGIKKDKNQTKQYSQYTSS